MATQLEHWASTVPPSRMVRLAVAEAVDLEAVDFEAVDCGSVELEPVDLDAHVDVADHVVVVDDVIDVVAVVASCDCLRTVVALYLDSF